MVEGIAVAFSIAYVILAARGSIWCWPMGVIGSLLSIWLFIEAKIYAEVVLYAYYVAMGLYGWYAWSAKSKNDQLLAVVKWHWHRHLLILLSGYMGTFVLYKFLHSYTDAEMPFLDSYTTVFAFIATWLVAKRVLENWIYWIAIDSLTVYLYLARGLELYALLSFALTVMAVYGYFSWRKLLPATCKENEPHPHSDHRA